MIYPFKQTDSCQWPVLMATLPTEQRKGYMTLVTQAMCDKVSWDFFCLPCDNYIPNVCMNIDTGGQDHYSDKRDE